MLAEIALPVPVDKTFTYAVPRDMEEAVAPGCRVIVPFGRRRMTGYVLSLGAEAPEGMRIRELSKLVDEVPLITPALFDLAGWMSEYYVHPIGEVLRAVLPAGIKGKGRAGAGDERDDFPEDAVRPKLTEPQEAARLAVAGSLRDGPAGSFLLYGVTGSGKTEVYLRCIEEVLEAGRSALVLVPEIALIPQSTARFRRRFGSDVSVLHSRLTGPRRSTIWKKAAAGEAKVVIGPRSAVFVPLRDLGIIVIDEEQDPSFKQEEKPHYNAVDVARFRAEREGAALVLGSATPSLETWALAREGKIESFRFPSRPGGSEMPPVDIVDMRGREGLICDELLEELEGCTGRDEQAIILINRRGHAHYVQCRECGWIDRCPECSISLTYHSRGHNLVCHYCGYRQAPPERCPRCGAYRVIQRGAGTQRVEMELRNLLSGASVLRMDLDTTAGVRGHLDILERFGRHEADILLGTQMVAKGHHYPDVTLVGVLSSDAGLNFPDFRAAERTFQLLSQAAGRTGRGKRGGKVVVQSFAPDHYIYEFLKTHDFERFASFELALRKPLGYPPEGRIMMFTTVSSSRQAALKAAGRVHGAIAGAGVVDESRILGPTPAVVEKLRGKYRFQLLVKGTLEPYEKKKLVLSAESALAKERGVELQWNVDPVSFF